MRAVLLDRDGVLNRAIVREGRPYAPANVQELEIPEGVLEALNRLKAKGFLLIGVTNQPDVVRGTTTRENVEAINQQLLLQLPLETIYVCYHDDKDHCGCRKPAPGLLLEAAKAYNLDLSQSFMVGDRWKDIAAGTKAGCKTLFLDMKYQEVFPREITPDFTADSLMGCVEWIINGE